MIYSVFNIYRYIAIIVAAGLLALASCKRDEPVNTIETPVFGIRGTIGGAPVNIKAGVDSYYLYTSYSHDVVKQLYSFSGELKRANCTDCRNSLKVTIYDSVNNNGTNPVNINLVLQKNDFEYATNAKQTTYSYNFYAEDVGFTSPTYTWKMDTITIGTSKDITGTFFDTATRDICLIVNDAIGSCSDQRCNPVKPVEDFSTDTCLVSFSYTINNDTVHFFSGSTSGTNVWDFGDLKGDSGLFSTHNFITHVYDTLKTFEVCLTRKSICTRTLCKTVKLDPASPCTSNFSYRDPVVDTSGIIVDLSKVEINYIDASGEQYSSRLQNQPPGSFFKMLSQMPYNRNEKGESTRRIGISFSCRVYSTTSSKFIDLVIAESNMAVAHP
ncbi:MAG TPA: hypothetical protein VEC12_14750 [Bacteroidia bacterium]|nr:hypothetical protein [Bacteroidia bacterium]